MVKPRPGGRHITTECILPPPLDEAPDEADAPEDRGPSRRCIVTRASYGKDEMIRFVLGPDRVLVPDVAAKLPGRGIWLSARGDVIETARAQGVLAKAFARAARGPVTVPADLTQVLQTALLRRLGELLGLARRAGQAVAGFQKAHEWLRSGHAVLVVQAVDGSVDERARVLSGAPPGILVVTPMCAAELGRVFGRDHVVHVVVAHGRLAELLKVEAGRLAGLAKTVGGQMPTRLHSPDGNATGDDEMNKRAGV